MTTSQRSPKAASQPLTAAPAVRTSLGDVVAERLREAILNDQLSPGQHLREEEISETLDVSRGPVRDALLMLEREGLVNLSRHRGATVVELSLEDLGEVYSMRSALEQLAIQLAIRRHEAGDIDRLEASLGNLQTAMRKKITEQAAARLDVDFHDAIFRAAHHDRLYKSWSNIRMQVYWFMLSRNVAGPEWRGSQVANHRGLLDLILAGNEVKAADAIGAHLRSSYETIWAALTDGTDPDTADIDGDGPRSFLLG
jgi:DNA-binding GntR family transcriptional regulator